MEEIKELVVMLERLPNFALWVIAAVLVYKVVFIGSVYGVIKFAIDKLHSWLTTPKHELVKVRLLLDGEVITGTKDALMVQLGRIKRSTGQYVHQSDVDWLREAIDEKIAREPNRGKAAA